MGLGISELTRHTRWSVVISALVLVGCSSQTGILRDRAGDYAREETMAPLKLPEGAEARELGDILVIPPAARPGQTLPQDFQVPKPGRRLTAGGNQYAIERSGGQQWLSTTLTPEQAWLGVTGYANGLGVDSAGSNPENGILTTQWYNFDADAERGVLASTLGKLIGDDSREDRFRFELRPVAPGVTDIHVAHQGRSPEQQTVPDGWNNLAERSEQINSFVLGELLVFLAGNEADGNTSTPGKVAALVAEPGVDGNGNPVLTLRGQNFAQVWDAVSVALGKAGFNVVDRDRSSGLFYLEDSPAGQQEPEKTGGFWSGLFGSDKDEAPTEGQRNTVTVRVSSYPELVQLSVERDANTSAPAQVSSQLLKLIQDNLQ